MAIPGRISDPLALGKLHRVLGRFDDDPKIAEIASLFDWRASDVHRFSEKIGSKLIEKLSRLRSSLKELPAPLKIDHVAIPGEGLDDIFLYDLQAPGKEENYFLLSKFGLLKAIGKSMNMRPCVGLSGNVLSSYNKEFESAESSEIDLLRNRRLAVINRCNFEVIRYEMPENIDEVLKDLEKDRPLSNLVDGEAAQAFGWENFQKNPEKRNLARKYFVSQIIEMLRYCAENDGKICIHFGPESERAWDKVIAVILREQKGSLFGIDSLNSGFFAIHYARPRVNGSLVLPYSPKKLEQIPLLSDNKNELERKLSELSILEREQLLIGLKVLDSDPAIAIYGNIQPQNLAEEMIRIAKKRGFINGV